MAEQKKAKLNIVEMNIDDLIPADYNPRLISDDARLGLEHSMRKHGYVQNIIFNSRTGKLVSGHQRVKVLKSDGYSAVDVNVVDLSEDQEKVLNVEMNNKEIEGDWDNSIEALLDDIRNFDPETYDTSMMYKIVSDSDVVLDIEEEEVEKMKELKVIPRMELQPFESYNILSIVCRDVQDFKYLTEKFGLKKMNVSPIGGKEKIGFNRIVEAGVVIKAVNSVVNSIPDINDINSSDFDVDGDLDERFL